MVVDRAAEYFFADVQPTELDTFQETKKEREKNQQTSKKKRQLTSKPLS